MQRGIVLKCRQRHIDLCHDVEHSSNFVDLDLDLGLVSKSNSVLMYCILLVFVESAA